jgi:hypothetical protein
MSETPQGGEKKGWWKRQTLTAKILIVFVCFIAIIVIAGVAFVASLPTYTTLNVTSDLNNMGANYDQVTIIGTTDPGANVTVNGQAVNADSSGKFSYQVTNVPVGIMNITVIAKVTGKEATTAILESNRQTTSDGGGTITIQLINQTNAEIQKY